jgi:hypothetical protein
VDRSWHLSLLAGPVRGHHSDEPSSAGHRPCRALQVGDAFASYRITPWEVIRVNPALIFAVD